MVGVHGALQGNHGDEERETEKPMKFVQSPSNLFGFQYSVSRIVFFNIPNEGRN